MLVIYPHHYVILKNILKQLCCYIIVPVRLTHIYIKLHRVLAHLCIATSLKNSVRLNK
jgi:hypothetical protein